MHKKTIIGIIIAVIVILGAWYFTSQNTETRLAETVKVKIADLPVVHGLPVYLAIEKGYFKEAGIEVELIKYEAPNQIIDAIMTGQVDFTSPSGALGITGIADFKNPGKLKVYAVSGGSNGNSGVNFIVPVSSTLSSLSDLRGKKLGILAGSIQWRTITREILENNNLDMDKDLTIVELAPSVQIEALASNQIDALLAIEPVPTTAISKGIAKIWIADPTLKYIADPSWLGAGIVNSQFADKNPETTAKVVQIIGKAISDIKQDQDQYRKYLKGYTSLTDDLISKVPIVDIKICDSMTNKDRESVQKFFDIFTKHKIVSGNIMVSNLLYCK